MSKNVRYDKNGQPIIRDEKGQIPKGHSGNLRGRKPKEKPHMTLQRVRGDVLWAMEEETTITVNGKKKKVPIISVVYQQLLLRAAQGDVRCIVEAIRLQSRLLAQHETVREQLLSSVLETEREYEDDPDSFTDPQKRAFFALKKAVFDYTQVF